MSLFLALDVGTTHTRAWLVSGDAVLAERRAAVGVRDTAREGSNARLRAGLVEVIRSVEHESGRSGLVIVASGMIGSPLGLCDVPHVDAPAGLDDLAAALQPVEALGVVDRPIWIVPGVRTRAAGDPAELDDVMRGEETLCLGALACGMLEPGDTLVSIGSHWKRVRIDREGRVAGSRSSLGGEIVDAVKTTTVLAAGLPDAWPERLLHDAVASGVEAFARVGLPRALFELRLHHLAVTDTPDERLAFLAGVVIGADLGDWPASQAPGRLVLSGASPIAEAWAAVLDGRGRSVVRLEKADAGRAHRIGLQQVARRGGILS